MFRALRIITGLSLAALLLYAANAAVRDCATGAFSSDNCLWLRVRNQLGLPQNQFLRAVTLEFVGVAILAGLYLTVRYVFPRFGGRRLSHTVPQKNETTDPNPGEKPRRRSDTDL